MTGSTHNQCQITPVVTSAASWAPERVVDQGQAEHLISHAFPELRGHSVQPLAEGWDNSVYLVGDALAFRFPRRAMALPGIRREISVLQAIAPVLPLPIPTPRYVGMDDHHEDPWPFFGTKFISGSELALSGLTDAQRVRAAEAAGAFLRALHVSTTLAAALAVAEDELPTDPMNRAWPRARTADTRRLLQELARDGTWASDPRVESLLDEAADLAAPSSDVALVHGDLHIRHLLVDTLGSEARATGVIDWGDVCIGDPAIDLSLGFAAFQGEARHAFLDAYGRIDAERELRARALAIRLSATLATYARATGQDELAAESLRGLARVVS